MSQPPNEPPNPAIAAKERVRAILTQQRREQWEQGLEPEIKKKRKKNPESEYNQQKIVVKWLEARGLVFAAVPNGSYFGKDREMAQRQNSMLRATGMQPGFPDLLIFSRTIDDRKRGVALEMKSKTGKPKPEQIEWLYKLNSLGWLTMVAYGADDAIDKLGLIKWL